MGVRFSSQLVPELIQPFWAALQGGEFSPMRRPWPELTAGVVCSGCVRLAVFGLVAAGI